MTKPKIAVIGDIILDHYYFGESNRLSPEAPVPVVKITGEQYLLGGSCNVVRNLQIFGADVQIFGIIGQDFNGDRLLGLIGEINVDDSNLVRVKNRATTIKSRVQVGNQQIVRIDNEDERDITKETELEILKLLSIAIKSIDIVIISDYSKGLLTTTLLKKLIDMCNDHSVKILVDPKGKDFSKYKGVFLCTPNKLEASIATGEEIKDSRSLNLVMNKLKVTLNVQHQIITMGADGIAYSNANNVKLFPALSREVLDVTGAGDTVIAALGFRIALGESIENAIEFANKAASIVIQKHGPSTASLDEINSLLD